MTTINNIPDASLRNILTSGLLIKAQLPPQPYEARLVLSSVCSKWRNIILTDPAFWQNIVFQPLPLFKNPLNLFSLANTWLTRSGCLPLSLEFNEKLQYYLEKGRKPKYMVHFLFGGLNFNAFYAKVISGHAARIRWLTCNLITKATITSFLSIPSESFQNLEAISIRFMDEITLPSSLKLFTVTERGKFKVFCSLPQLRNVVLEICVGSGMRPLYIELPWHQLTSLQMDKTPICPKYFLKILEKTSPSLVDGFFNIMFGARSTLVPNGYLTLVAAPRLESLRLRLINPSADPRLFKFVRLPALRTLWVELVDVKKGWDMGLYKSLLLHSTNTLHSLALCNPPAANLNLQSRGLKENDRSLLRLAVKLEALLYAINNVATLRLPAGLYIGSTTLKKIASGELLPLLRHLKVSSTSITATGILAVVRKRYENFICALHAASTSQDRKSVPPFSLFSVDLTTVWVGKRRTASSKGWQEVHGYLCYGTCIRFIDEWLTKVD